MSIITKTCLTIALTKILFTPVMASNFDDFYFSINSGYSKFSNDCIIYGETECKDEGISYNFNIGSYIYESVALELGYTKPNKVISGDYDMSLNSYSAGLRFESPTFNGLKFSIKPYLGFQEAKYSPSLKAKNGDFIYGIGSGVEYKVTELISIVADYSFTTSSEIAVIDGSAFHQATLGVKFIFPKEKINYSSNSDSILPEPEKKLASDDYLNPITYYELQIPVTTSTKTAAYFPLGKSEFINLNFLESIVATLKAKKLVEIEVVGFADATGTKKFNEEISELRAKKVAQYLIDHGISSDIITVKGSNYFHGEKGMPNQSERRVTLNLKELQINN